VLFHELRGLPVHQFAFGTGGAALGFRSFRSDLLKIPVGIKSGLGTAGSGGVCIGRRGGIFWMIECPFENAMDDQVRVAADGRSEMRVFVKTEGEVAERLGGIAGLLE
jgi:hypothetical protein